MVNISTELGSISITSEVFTNIAGAAATSCFGVKGMAGRNKEGGPRQLLRRESMSKGVITHLNDDGTLSLEDVALMNDALTVQEENERRFMAAKEKERA